jgi:hypothetical protein
MRREGAVTYEQCPYGGGPGRCQCGTCAVCGHKKHTSIHGPSQGEPAGSEPVGHEFVAKANRVEQGKAHAT